MKPNNNQGFTLIEIMIVVAIIIILAVIAVPAFNQARLKSQRAACVNNLRQLDGGKDLYALENNGNMPADQAALVSAGIVKREADCPAGGTYGNISSTSNDVNCSKSAAPEDHRLDVLLNPTGT